jgi:hypothetical protein
MNWSLNSANWKSASSSNASNGKAWMLTELPQTWTTENVLILTSLVMASVIFFKRRKK